MADLTKAVGQSHTLAPYQIARPKALKIKRRIQQRKDLAFDPEQPRDESGRWAETGGDSAALTARASRAKDEKFREALRGLAKTAAAAEAAKKERLAREQAQKVGRAERERAVAVAPRRPYPHTQATHVEVEGRLKALVPDVFVSETKQTAITAASHVAEVLEEMHAQGYAMPDKVVVELSAKRSLYGSTTFEAGGKHTLLIQVPKTLPATANLDDAAVVAFGGRAKAPDDPSDPQMHDRFAVRSMNDVVRHELGHVLAGHRNDTAKFKSRGLAEVARTVSLYAASDGSDEFLAESFVKLSRGETLPLGAQKLYTTLNGPTVKR